MPRARDAENYVVASVKLKIEHDDRLLDLVERYIQGLRHCVHIIIERDLRRISEIHRACYELLKTRYGLPPNVAVACYTEAQDIVKAWRELPDKMRGRTPVITSRHMRLSKKIYSIDWDRMIVRIVGAGEYRIIGWPKNLEMYLKEWEQREAKLVVRVNGAFVHVSFRKPKTEAKPSLNAIAVDVNMREIIFGRPGNIVRIPTRVEDCIRIKKHMEYLQRKYSLSRYRPWLARRRIRKRISELGERIRSITDDFVKKASKRIVDFAKRIGCDTIVIEDLTGLRDAQARLRKPWRERLLFTTYRRLLWWIEYRATKEGLAVVRVEPRGTSSTCPVCGSKLIESGYRRLRCPACGFEEDRDIIAIHNLLKRLEEKLSIQNRLAH